MYDLRDIIYDALEPLGVEIELDRSDEIEKFPLITFSEISNINYDNFVARVEYQVDIFTDNFRENIDLVKKVDDIMRNMGFNRNYITPDSMMREEKKRYHKALNYEAYIDALNGYIKLTLK